MFARYHIVSLNIQPRFLDNFEGPFYLETGNTLWCIVGEEETLLGNPEEMCPQVYISSNMLMFKSSTTQ